MSKSKRRKIKQVRKNRAESSCNLCHQRNKLTRFGCCVRCAYISGKISDPLLEPLISSIILTGKRNGS
jgi:hypothetical protein